MQRSAGKKLPTLEKFIDGASLEDIDNALKVVVTGNASRRVRKEEGRELIADQVRQGEGGTRRARDGWENWRRVASCVAAGLSLEEIEGSTLSQLQLLLAGAEERRFYEITLPEIKRFIGKVGDEEVKSILSGTTKPEGEARKLAFQKLVREALPTHLREIKPVGPDGIPEPLAGVG